MKAVVLVTACAAIQFARAAPLDAPLPPLAAQSVATVADSRPTWGCQDWAPSSQLSLEEGWRLAVSLAGLEGRDVVVGTVKPTGSMRPFFNENSLLLLEAAPYSELRLGDVVTFRHPTLDIVVVHRLTERRGDFFWSKGDHNRSMDNAYVTPQNYLRRLIGVIYLQPKPKPAAAGTVAKAGRVGAPAGE